MAARARAKSGLIGWIVVAVVIVGASIFYFRWRATHATAPMQYRTVKADKGMVAAAARSAAASWSSTPTSTRR